MLAPGIGRNAIKQLPICQGLEQHLPSQHRCEKLNFIPMGEAMSLGHDLIIMRGGRIEQAGTPLEVYTRPATPFVATFLGSANLLEGECIRSQGHTMLRLPFVELPVPEGTPVGPCRVMLRPEDISIHGDAAMARAFLDYHPQETHVALGDLVDSRLKVDLTEEMKCLDLMLQSSALLLWGNHDLAYLPERPWRSFGNFDELTFRDQYQANRGRFAAACAVDGWLCTHAGVSSHVAKLMSTETLAGGVKTIATWINAEFAQQLRKLNPDVVAEGPRYGFGPLFQIPICRGGHHGFGGIFWCDFDGEQTQPSPAVGPQIFGHCPVTYPERGKSFILHDGEVLEGPSWLNMNALYDGCWIYDTKTDQIVDLKTGRPH